MKVPRIETLVARNNQFPNSKGMRIPTDLRKPMVLFQGTNPNCEQPNRKLNFIA